MAKKQITYDRNTPGKLLGHKPDDWRRALRAVLRVSKHYEAPIRVEFEGNDSWVLAQEFEAAQRQFGFETEVRFVSIPSKAYVKYWKPHRATA
jgi:hypothetical protein